MKEPDICSRLYRIGEYLFDVRTGELTCLSSNVQHRLTPKAAELLVLLVQNQGELLSYDVIIDQLWPNTVVDYKSSIHFNIREIRKIVDCSKTDLRYIVNLPKRGYKLVASVEEVRHRPGRASLQTININRDGVVSRRLICSRRVYGMVAFLCIGTLVLIICGDASKQPQYGLAIQPDSEATPSVVYVRYYNTDDGDWRNIYLNNLYNNAISRIGDQSNVVFVGVLDDYAGHELAISDYGTRSVLDFHIHRAGNHDVIRGRITHPIRGMLWADQWGLMDDHGSVFDNLRQSLPRVSWQ